MENSDMKELSISVTPLPHLEVEYFRSIPILISITNNSNHPILVESITLRLQTDADFADVYIEENDSSLIEQGLVKEFQIKITPTPEFLANTNQFGVSVLYRKSENQKLGLQYSQRLEPPFPFIIIKPTKEILGKLFISFKQPEDIILAELLERLAKRAGFSVYMAVNDPNPGIDLWERIEPELKTSTCALILWTKYTNWGTGVPHEVKLCREYNIPDVLIIQDGLELPEAYKGTGIEYQRFNPNDPLTAFAQVITTQRKLALLK